MHANNRAPAVFIGHGAPIYALQPNPFTPTWARFASRIATPSAILSVSAHWYGPGLEVTAQTEPPTIHDFDGFPQEFFEINYPAPGAPWLAAEVGPLVAPRTVSATEHWGLDHGTWTVLMHMWPEADIPVAQLRLDATLTSAELIDLGKRLAPLRDQGVLVLGSGNVVHNLPLMQGAHLGDPSHATPWNERFDRHIHELCVGHDLDGLARWHEHPDAALAAPTPEHFLPLLVVAGARLADDRLESVTDGYDAGTLSMRSLAYVA